MIDNYKKLEVGQCFKNYGALQTFLEEPYKKGGKSRQLQLTDWQRYFDYIKEGQKYTITDVYETPTPKIDHRGETANRAIYSKHIELLILDMLQNTDNGNWTGNKSQLYTELGLVGENYNKFHYNEDNQLWLMFFFESITKWQLKNFYRRAESKLYQIVMSALRSMSDKSLIRLEERIYIRPCTGPTYIADSEDRKAILRAENEVLEEMGYETKSQVYLAQKMSSFYDRVGDILNARYHWLNHYKLIHIISNKDRNEIALTNSKKEFERLCLNNHFLNYIQENATKEYQHMVDKSFRDYQNSLESKGLIPEISQNEYTYYDARQEKVFYPPAQYIDTQHLIGNITIPLDTIGVYRQFFNDIDQYSNKSIIGFSDYLEEEPAW